MIKTYTGEINMKKTISLLLIIFLSLLSLYAVTDIIGSIYLVTRYEHFDLRASGFIAGKIAFTALCLVIIYFLTKITRKKYR